MVTVAPIATAKRMTGKLTKAEYYPGASQGDINIDIGQVVLLLSSDKKLVVPHPKKEKRGNEVREQYDFDSIMVSQDVLEKFNRNQNKYYRFHLDRTKTGVRFTVLYNERRVRMRTREFRGIKGERGVTFLFSDSFTLDALAKAKLKFTSLKKKDRSLLTVGMGEMTPGQLVFLA